VDADEVRREQGGEFLRRLRMGLAFGKVKGGCPGLPNEEVRSARLMVDGGAVFEEEGVICRERHVVRF
jgi:hypothetical protein